MEITLLVSLVVLALTSQPGLGQKELCLDGAKFAYDTQDCRYYYACVGPNAYRMPCPDNLVFSLRQEQCVYRESVFAKDCIIKFGIPGSVNNVADSDIQRVDTTPAAVQDTDNDENIASENNSNDDDNNESNIRGIAIERRCMGGDSMVAHEDMCHRYFDCKNPHMGDLNDYLLPYEYECEYPQLFSTETMRCENFTYVQCRNRMEPLAPCDYSNNMCMGPNCRPCKDEHASCVGQPDGLMYWPGREGTGFWVECYKQRTVSEGNCGSDVNGMMMVFSTDHGGCILYSQIVEEICQWTGATLPHEMDCHRYYDCTGYDSNASAKSSKAFIVTCPYPQLFSPLTGKCEPYSEVNCRSRRVGKTPCDYMSSMCDDPTYASCMGLPDGDNVYRSREGSPYYVECRDERTVAKGMCPIDDNGLYKIFAPGPRLCVSVQPVESS